MTRNSVLWRGFLADPSSIAKILTSSFCSSANVTWFECFNNSWLPSFQYFKTTEKPRGMFATERCMFATERCMFATERCMFATECCMFPTERCMFATECCMFPTDQSCREGFSWDQLSYMSVGQILTALQGLSQSWELHRREMNILTMNLHSWQLEGSSRRMWSVQKCCSRCWCFHKKYSTHILDVWVPVDGVWSNRTDEGTSAQIRIRTLGFQPHPLEAIR